MPRKRTTAKGRREGGAFIALPCAVLEHDNFARLSPKAVKLLMDLLSQIRVKAGGPANNGDLSLAWAFMEARGWVSKDTLYKARNELVAAGFLVKTRQGGQNLTSLYGVTWWAINDCGGKLDIAPTDAPLGTWREAAPINGKKILGTNTVPGWPGERTNAPPH